MVGFVVVEKEQIVGWSKHGRAIETINDWKDGRRWTTNIIEMYNLAMRLNGERFDSSANKHNRMIHSYIRW